MFQCFVIALLVSCAFSHLPAVTSYVDVVLTTIVTRHLPPKTTIADIGPLTGLWFKVIRIVYRVRYLDFS